MSIQGLFFLFSFNRLVLVALHDVKILLNHLIELGPLLGSQKSVLENSDNMLKMFEFVSLNEIPDEGAGILRLTSMDASMIDKELDRLDGQFILDFCKGKKSNDSVDSYLATTLAQLESMVMEF